jgi:2-haloacid dehalogenase
VRAIDAVIFDVGGVLYDWNIRYLYEKLIDDPDRLDWFLENVVTTDWHFQHDAGRHSRETVPERVAMFPDQRALIELYPARWLETVGDPIPGMIELVSRLADAGLRLFGITNFSDEFWAMFRPTAPVFDRFDDIVVSGTERIMKPDPAIFALARQRFQVAPTRAIFVDDRSDNVKAAVAAGYLGHHFCGAEGLAERLAALGIS